LIGLNCKTFLILPSSVVSTTVFLITNIWIAVQVSYMPVPWRYCGVLL
jgi:hypothetical protein